MRNSWHCGCRGFMLIDTILMITLLGVGLFGVMTYFATVNRNVLDQDMTVTASVLAQDRVDRVVADKSALGYNAIVAALYPSPEALAGNFSGFTRTTTILEVNPANMTAPLPGSGLKRIDVNVQWGNAPNEQVQLTTLLGLY